MTINPDQYISHLYQDPVSGEWAIQTNDEHSLGVARLAAEFASAFGMRDWGYIMGLLHDKGKETKAFQAHIKKESGFDSLASSDEDYSHAYIGALMARDLFKKESPLIINALAGHHRGLYDKADLAECMKRDIPSEVTRAIPFNSNLNRSMPTFNKPEYQVNYLIRMLFSCLVDADYLDTEKFMQPESAAMRSRGSNMTELLNRFERHLSNLKKTAPKTPVNDIRNRVQDMCRQNSDSSTGFYEMTVPTGGGKTLASMLWALRHAVANNLDHIIIAIPYTSIIEQTAQIFKSIFGDENVLEHHSAMSPDHSKDENIRNRLKLATENWDYPIIVTTNVRLFESIFSNKPSACRRLHNLASSVIIIDEVQTLPISYYEPILGAMNAYVSLFRSSILMTTASQPALYGPMRGTNPFVKCSGLSERPMPVISHDEDFWLPLRRANLNFIQGHKNCNEIAETLRQHERVLCIVNTRRIANEIFTALGDVSDAFHLSRMMCPLHIKEKLNEVRQRLSSFGQPVKVIATQLIEAGVDVDFPVVYRQEAGLDSVIQAAGRCNREGRLSSRGDTFIFSLSETYALPSGHISKANHARLDMPSDSDWFSDKAMGEYFKRLYFRTDSFDKNGVALHIRNLNFETASNNFKYIENNSIPVLVNWRDSLKLAERYDRYGPSYGLIKEIGQYCVNISNNDFEKLMQSGAIEDHNGLYVIPSKDFYNDATGLNVHGNWLDEPIII